MKRTLSALSLTLASGATWALPPATVPDVEIFMAGATAQQKNLPTILKEGTGLCQAGTLDIYYDDNAVFGGSAAGSNYRAYSCTLRAASPVPAALQNKTFLLHYRLVGGSILGINPLARAQAISRLAVDTSSCAGARSASVPNYKCISLANAVPDLGLSDQEPQVFVGDPNLPDGETALAASELSKIKVQALMGILFGVTMSDNLYQALQAQQGKTVGDFSDAQRPTISSAQYTSIITANGGPYNTDWTALLGTDHPPIRVCRRIKGVGQQIANNALWGGYPCSPSALLPSTAADSVPGQYEVVENNLIPDMRACLKAANTAGTYAIGALWLDNTPDGWHYTKIDGLSPLVSEATAGRYPFFQEETAQYRLQTVNGVLPPSGNKLSAIRLLIGEFIKPANIKVTDGWFALPTNGFTPAQDAVVSKVSRQGSTCRAPLLFF